MKIAVDISDLHAGKADGTTRFTYELAKRFSSIGTEDTWLYFSSGDVSRHYPLHDTSADIRVSPWPKYWTQSRFPFDLFEARPDVLFMPIQQLPYVRPGSMKTVCVVHDLAFHVYPEQFTYRDWVLQHVFTGYAAREADHLVCVSESTRRDVGTFYGREKNVHVIHHGIDHDQFYEMNTDEKLQSWKLIKNWQPRLRRPYVLYVGQIQPRKNLIRLMKAFELVSPEYQLVIAGGHGWLQDEIVSFAGSSAVADRIVLTDRVPDDLLPGLYGNADVFVLPSLYEGFGIPIVEAMACGVPVVTSDVSSMPEVSGGAAVLVDPLRVRSISDGITQALKSRDTLRASGLSMAKKYSWDTCADAIYTILTYIDDGQD